MIRNQLAAIFFFFTLPLYCGKFGLACQGKATAAARAALISSKNACRVFSCFHKAEHAGLQDLKRAFVIILVRA